MKKENTRYDFQLNYLTRGAMTTKKLIPKSYKMVL